MSKREINRPIRRVERKRISLDSHKRSGRLKSPVSDIASVWAEQDIIREREASKKLKKRSIHKDKLKALFTGLLRLPWNKLLKNLKRRKVYLSIALVIITLIIGVNISNNNNNGDKDVLGGTTDIKTDELVEEKPTFKALLPIGKTEKDLSFKRVSPQNSDPSYVYIDQLEGKQINVTQQLLPEKFKNDQDSELEKLARDFQATNVIQIDGNKIYHGYSEKANVQSLIFIKNNLLVLIRLSGKISDESWVSYISTLNN
jgi:hypothetical protein